MSGGSEGFLQTVNKVGQMRKQMRGSFDVNFKMMVINITDSSNHNQEGKKKSYSVMYGCKPKKPLKHTPTVYENWLLPCLFIVM